VGGDEGIEIHPRAPSRTTDVSRETIRVQQQSDWTTLVPVTGEAVALDLRVAQFPSRTLGLLLDLAVQLVMLFVVIWLTGELLASADPALAAGISLVSVVLVIVGWPSLLETLTRGRSLGKLATGQRVVRADGGPVRFRHSFVRALFMLVDFWITAGAAGLITSLASKQGQRIGDHFAGTVVIRERVPTAARPVQLAYVMPAGLEQWAAGLDLARLPDVAALQARQLLARSGTLAPEVRAGMGQQLAAEFSAYVSPPPPPGTPPEAFLAAVLTERMRRSSAAVYRARSDGVRLPAGGPAPGVTSPTAAAPPPAGRPAVARTMPPGDGPFAPPA
jgi:uncharacterized RDD family membrane protein YckC